MAEMDDLKWQQSQKESEAEQCEHRIANLKEKIARLNNFKKSVDQYRSEINTISIPFGNYPTMCCDNWTGENYKWFKSQCYDNVCQTFSDMENSIGDMRDRLCIKIRDLENEIYDQQGLLGDIKKALNNIGTAIENFFN